MSKFSLAICVGFLWGCQPANGQQPVGQPQATSLLGQPLSAARPSLELLQRLREHRLQYESDPHDSDKLIWYGRFLAYAGDYHAAIKIYTRGIELHPADPRMLRHRAHRYITLRQFEKAIADMERAIELIAGKPNEIEPDGMPNAQNIPISTLHGNIYYHLGLAHYLLGDFPSALAAYQKCLDLKTNDDNTVSATHWIYMIYRRMGKAQAARQALVAIHDEMQIIENHSYHRACLFYKGKLSLEEVDRVDGEAPADDALRYAIANWHFYNKNAAQAQEMFQQLVDGAGWQSFGHIAAEADLARLRDR